MPDPGAGSRSDAAPPAGPRLSTELDSRASRGTDEVLRLVNRLSSGEGSGDGSETGNDAGVSRLIVRLARALSSSAKSAGTLAVAGGRWLADLVDEMAPQLPIRDRAALSAAYGGKEGDELAEALVRAASRATAAVGAAGGALAAAEMLATPSLLGVPVQLAAETLVVVAVEMRLIGELHEVYRCPLQGNPRQRAAALVTAWVRRRGVDTRSGMAGTALGVAARRELRTRILRRLGRNVTTLAPFLAGAVAGAEINRRETLGLADRIRRDLRRM